MSSDDVRLVMKLVLREHAPCLEERQMDSVVAALMDAGERDYAIVERDRWERWCTVLQELARLNYERPGSLGEEAQWIMSEMLKLDDARYLFGGVTTRIAWEFAVVDGERVQP